MSKPIDTSVRRYDITGTVIEKYCKGCNSWSSINNFYIHKQSNERRNKEKHQSKRISCTIKINKEWYKKTKSSN